MFLEWRPSSSRVALPLTTGNEVRVKTTAPATPGEVKVTVRVEDPNREGLLKTPNRVARAYAELVCGSKIDPRQHLRTVFHEKYQEVVLLRDIPFCSICEHHLLPFMGRAHVAYLPDGRVVGLSKLARLVEGYARRPQVQERLTTQIGDALQEVLEPGGVGVIIEAMHLCMAMRGVQKQNSSAVTSSLTGSFRDDDKSRNEFLSLINHR